MSEHPGVQREIYRRRLLEARHAYVHGSETLEELSARFQVEKGDLTRMSRREGWPERRKLKREELARAFEARTAVSITNRRAGFLSDATTMISTLGQLITLELARIKEGRANANGIPPTLADTKAVAEALLKYVTAGKIAYAIPDDIQIPQTSRRTQGFIDVEPVAPEAQPDPFAIEAPPAPNSPIE